MSTVVKNRSYSSAIHCAADANGPHARSRSVGGSTCVIEVLSSRQASVKLHGFEVRRDGDCGKEKLDAGVWNRFLGPSEGEKIGGIDECVFVSSLIHFCIFIFI